MSLLHKHFFSLRGGIGIRLSSSLQPPPKCELDLLNSSPELANKARDWLAYFKSTEIPRNYVEVTFSRSSGPGGQNVNKLNTKATVRCSLYEKWIPVWARENLRRTPFYATSSSSLLIKSDVSRSQMENVAECMKKLHDVILTAASSPIRNETSEDTKRRVNEHIKAAERKRKAEKMRRSAVKQGRRAEDF